jgi:hypothetical protein
VAAAPSPPPPPAAPTFTSAGLERRAPGSAFPNQALESLATARLGSPAQPDAPATDDEARFASLSSFQSAVLRGRNTDVLAGLDDANRTDRSREDH